MTSTVTVTSGTAAVTAGDARTGRRRQRGGPERGTALRGTGRPNWVGGVLSVVWLAIVVIPIYWILVTSFKSQDVYFLANPLAPPSAPTVENYEAVLQAGFARYFFNSVVVTLGSVVPAVLVSFLAAYAIIRSPGRRLLQGMNSLFLMGLAIPLQATIIPVYLLVIKLGLYNTLGGIVLPSIAFSIPLSVLVFSNFIRDVPKELFESMRTDGASEWGTLWNLAFPLTRPALVTVTVYNALAVWNGFLLPLILTTSPEKRLLPLALWTFQGEYGVNVPAVLASVVLTTLPILVLYVVGRRQLLSGLTAGFSK